MIICVNCYLQGEYVVEDINGRCDVCSSTNFEDKEDLDEYIKAEGNITHWIHALNRETYPSVTDNIE